MKVLAIITMSKTADPLEVRKTLVEELRKAWELFSGNIVREAYLTEEASRVVFVIESVDFASTRIELQKLPLVSRGCFDVQLIELRPFGNWEKLFSEVK